MAILDIRARRLDEWTLSASALPAPISVRTPSAWEDYGVPRTFEGPCDYQCALSVSPETGKRYWLRCAGVSYAVQGYLNETPIGAHRGIWDGFSWDITDALSEGDNTLRLQVIKNGGTTYPVPQVLSGFLPYVSCTFGGLWQPVYLFETGAAWLTNLYVRGEANGSVIVRGELGGALPAEVRLTVYAPDAEQVYQAAITGVDQWAHQLQIQQPLLWHPTHPHLYRLVAEVYHDGALSHCVETEFGLRTVSVDGSVILLNGEPFYPRGVLHWGWYLHTHAPSPEPEVAERELKAAQLCGFNLLKACLWIPSREYLRLCDRLGITVWLELPLWLPNMNAEQIAQTKREYEAIVKQVRNHPSIVLWTLGCELSTRFPSDALGELYALVKQLTGSPLVRDNSGGGECYGGALQEYADFADYHLYGDAHFARTTFRAFLDTHRPLAPWLQGEFADHDTQRDFQTLRQTTPAEQLWWLERDPEVNPQGVRWFYETPFVEERMQQAGVWDALTELVRNSRLEKIAYHKLVLETMRSLPHTSGYVVTGLKDTPIATAGILDERGEFKIQPESYTNFNADTVLLLDWHRRRDWIAGGDRPANPDPYNHFSGRTVYPRIAVSHFGKPIEAAELRWRIVSGLDNPVQAPQSGSGNPVQAPQSGSDNPVQVPQTGLDNPVQAPQSGLGILPKQIDYSDNPVQATQSGSGIPPKQIDYSDDLARNTANGGDAVVPCTDRNVRATEGVLVSSGTDKNVRATLGVGITFLTQLEISLPAVETPQSMQFEAELLSPEGVVIAANRWRWSVYPAPDWTSLGATAVYDPAETLGGLPASLRRLSGEEYLRFLTSLGMTEGSSVGDCHFERGEESPSTPSTLLTTQLESAQIEFVRQGGAALWVLNAPTPSVDCERVPFWREATHRFLPHALWKYIPRPEYLDERLFVFSTDLAIRATAFLDSPIQPLWQRVDTRTGYVHCYLGEVALGAGKLLLCTLHFAGHHGDTPLTLRYHPAGQYWLWAMLRYLASR